MSVKTTAIDLYKPHSGLDQFTGKQGSPTEVRVTVPGQRIRLFLVEVEHLEGRALHQGNRLLDRRVRCLEIRHAGFPGGAGIHPCQQIQSLVAPGAGDAGREGEVGILLSRFTDEVCGTALTKVTGLGRLTVDGDECRQISEPIFFMHHNGSQPGVNQRGIHVVARL